MWIHIIERFIYKQQRFYQGTYCRSNIETKRQLRKWCCALHCRYIKDDYSVDIQEKKGLLRVPRPTLAQNLCPLTFFHSFKNEKIKIKKVSGKRTQKGRNTSFRSSCYTLNPNTVFSEYFRQITMSSDTVCSFFYCFALLCFALPKKIYIFADRLTLFFLPKEP